MAIFKVLRDASQASLVGNSDYAALTAWWTGSASLPQKEQVNHLLCELHERSMWLACDCDGAKRGKDSHPLLAPVKNDAAVFLKRLTKREPHEKTCVFWSEQVEPVAGGSGGQGVAELAGMPSFMFDDEPPSVVKNRVASADRQDVGVKSERPSKLAKRLFWLAEKSGLQHAPRIGSSIVTLLALADTLSIAPALTLKDVLYCRPEVWVAGWADAAFVRCEAVGQAPICWWIQVITGADQIASTITFNLKGGNSHSATVAGELKIFGGDISPARFPMLAMCLIKKSKEKGVLLHSVYAHPIASTDRWMLVDSDLERQTLRDLAAVCEWLRAVQGIELTLEKPVHAWTGTGERPDFVLTLKSESGGSKHLVIETMGYQDPAYESRKASRAENVHSPVIFDRRTSVMSDGTELRRSVANWAMAGRL